MCKYVHAALTHDAAVFIQCTIIIMNTVISYMLYMHYNVFVEEREQ